MLKKRAELIILVKKISVSTSILMNFSVDKDCIVCSSPRECQLVLGTTAISGNYAYYDIVKKGRKFYIKISTVMERINELELRKDQIESNLSFMKQVIGGIKDGVKRGNNGQKVQSKPHEHA